MRGEWAYEMEGGGFKPEEATDKLTCPYVRGVGGEGTFKGSGEETELKLINVRTEGKVGVLGGEGMGWGERRRGEGGKEGVPPYPGLVI